ncbi:MAG: FAD-dependent oxidoreductase [Thermodesulfobacteriota bacterium]
MSAEHTPVLIVGGGVAGLAAAVDLDRRGVSSLIVEKSCRLGGQAADFCCKACEACGACGACARCGACRVGDLLREFAARPRVRALTQAMVVGARPAGRGWSLDLAPQPAEGGPACQAGACGSLGERTTLTAGAVILAVGHTPFDPRRKSRFGYGRVPGVMTAGELEKAIRDGGLPAGARRVAFIQCVGSRDAALGRDYCSRVCCGYALRLARLARCLDPERQVTFYHMDVQDYGQAWRGELAAMRRDFEFVRAIPGEVRGSAEGPVAVFSGAAGQPESRVFDLVVLSTGLEPPLAGAALAELFGLTRGRHGFLGQDGADAMTDAAGVFVAGAAAGPRSIVESIDHAALAAALAAAHAAAPAKEVAHA